MNLKRAKIFVCVAVVLTLCQCIQSQRKHNNNKRITHGVYAKLGSFPYMAVVHRLMSNKRVEQCTGTILSERWVLTSAHSVANYPRVFLVVFGIINKSGIKYSHLQGPGVSMITTLVFVHPRYKGTINDIALLRMPRNIPFSDTIQPIRFASHSDESIANIEARVIGWRKDEITGKSTMNLEYTIVSIISNDECKQHWNITKKNVCTTAGACQSDNGAPLVIVQEGREIQVGIVSYGDGYCPSNSPGVFTRVSSFTDWIEKITNM